MKLLSAFLVVVTLSLAVVWGISDTASEGEMNSYPLGESRQAATEAGSTPARLELAPGVVAAREPSGWPVEVFDVSGEFELPTSHWMPEAPPNIELEHPDGSWLLRHENGQIHERGAYKNDVEVGRWLWWYEDGQRMAVGEFEAGKRIGSWTWWQENGNLIAEGQYRDGEGFGPWRTYHENGARWGEGHYSADEKSGPWVFWNEDGSVDEANSGHYEAGVLEE